MKSLQEQLQNYLLNNDLTIQDHVIGTQKVSVTTRLAIYQNAYRLRLIDALVATYPMLHLYVGDDVFTDLSDEYLDRYPSTFRSIRWFGDQLAPYLKNHPDYSDYPILSELAQLEWMMTTVFDAADADCMKVEEIVTIPPDAWEKMRFKAHPSAALLSMSWNTVAIWQALTDDATPAEPEQSPEPVVWVLWRNELQNQFCSLSPDEAWAISAMLNDSSFGDICEGLCQWVDEDKAAMHAASLLKGWITAGLISEVIV